MKLTRYLFTASSIMRVSPVVRNGKEGDDELIKTLTRDFVPRLYTVLDEHMKPTEITLLKPGASAKTTSTAVLVSPDAPGFRRVISVGFMCSSRTV